MEKTNVIISQKFMKQLQDMNITEHITNPCQKAFTGNLRRLSSELFVLEDDKGNDICGLLDGATFFNALLETDVAHLFGNGNYLTN